MIISRTVFEPGPLHMSLPEDGLALAGERIGGKKPETGYQGWLLDTDMLEEMEDKVPLKEIAKCMPWAFPGPS